MRLQQPYFHLTVLLFLIEVCIAVFIDDQLIRPFVGDILVIALIYCFIQTFWNIPMKRAISGIFVFACLVELAQYFRLVDRLNLRGHFWETVIGTTFDWKDIVAYAIGAALIGWSEQKRKKIQRNPRFPQY